jgi:hypothetical protein
MAQHKREEVDNKKTSLVTIHSKPLINDSNYIYGIGKGKVMNSAHGRYGCDSLSLLYKIVFQLLKESSHFLTNPRFWPLEIILRIE